MPRNERLQQQRIARNWRQYDVADQLAVTVTTIQRWERGSQQPSAYYRAKLCALFGLSAQELGLVEMDEEKPEQAAEQPDVEAASKISLWTVPYARNLHFTGRDELLNQLEQQFFPQEPDQPTTIRRAALTQAQAIKGLGGIGKTQIAVEYAYRAREQGRYTHTLWITAASEEAILSSFTTLADLLPDFRSNGEMDQHKLVAAVLDWLGQSEQPWLLIFDNADDLSLVQPYLAVRGNGNMLFTTRASAVGSLASPIEVETMGIIEATQLLLRRIHRLTDASDEEIDVATNIVLALALFPLAIDQAGAYIEETGCRLRDYLQLYQTHRLALLARRGKQATGYPESVATTWSLSFQQVERAHPAAADLLRLCAFLSPDHIPEELLTEGAPYWPLALQQAVADPFSFNQLLETLLAFSLVKRLAEDHLLSIHRLVQVVQKEQLSPEAQRQWAEQLIQAVHTVFPRNPEDPVATWSRCLRYLEQAQACDTLIQEYQLLLPEAADLLNRTGTYFRECASYTLAEPLYQRALRIREQQLGPEHPDTAESLNNLAALYWKQGKYEQTEPLYQRALRIREQQLGPEHPDTAESLNNLALLYHQQGKYAQAEPLYQRALDIREQQLGSEHSNVAQSLNDLAFLYYMQGKYEQAEPLYQRTLHIWEQQVGPGHPWIAYPLNNLALLQRSKGKYVEAEPLHRQALRIWEQQLGPEHPIVAYPLTGLADLYRLQGKYGQAEQLYQRALHIWEQQVGSEYPEMTYALQGLANLYSEQGKYEQAEPLYQRALRIREQRVGLEHPETAAVLSDFAGFQQARGHASEAMSMYQRALTIREHVFGFDHPLTAEVRERLQAVVQEGRQPELEKRE